MKSNSKQIISTLLSIYLITIEMSLSNSERLLKCDHKKYPNIGCRNNQTQVCHKTSQTCRCAPEYPITLLNDICLQHRSINQSCMGSVQCTHIRNAGCYGLDTEFKDDFWVLLWFRFGFTNPGKCLCDRSNGFEYNNSSNSCIRKTVIGSKCRTGWDCNSKVSNSLCGPSDRCQCKTGFYYDSESDSCKLPLNYDEHCTTDEGCAGFELICVKGQCKCIPGYHFDKYKSNKCETNIGPNCLDNEGLGDCLERSLESIKTDRNLNKLSEFDLIEPPRIYSIFVILALWICLLFILGNAKRGLRLVEQAVRRDQSSQYRQCDTCTVQSVIEADDQELGSSQLSLQSDVSATVNQSYPPPTFDELYPNDCQPYSDEPPTYEEVVRLDKQKSYIV